MKKILAITCLAWTTLLLSACGMVLLTRIGLHSDYAADVLPTLPTLLIMGAGMGLTFAPSFSLGTSGVAADDAGAASASLNVSQQIGGSVGTSLLNTIATTAAAGYVTAHLAAAIFAGAAVVTALLLRSGVAADSGARTVAVHA